MRAGRRDGVLLGVGGLGWDQWVPQPEMLYNYPQGEDRVASSGLGTHILSGSEIAGAPPLDYRQAT